MQIINTINELQNALKTKSDIAFVPTMGNLHAGHLELVKIAKQQASFVIVSIFVNPLQFGENEDLSNYPRTLDADCEQLNSVGADIVFTPSVNEMYADFDGKNLNQHMTITPPPIADELCGATRSGHFSGVATVVSKLFNIVQPDIAVFGKKDFQQLLIIKTLVRQFNLPIKIITGETVRESDGLAMSSRNGYLNAMHRLEAPRLYKTLKSSAEAAKKEAVDLIEIEQQTSQYLTQLGWIVDYISIRSADTLMPAKPSDKQLIILGAAKLGKTRLIDNIEFTR